MQHFHTSDQRKQRAYISQVAHLPLSNEKWRVYIKNIRASRILGKWEWERKRERAPSRELIKFIANHKTAFAPYLKGL